MGKRTSRGSGEPTDECRRLLCRAYAQGRREHASLALAEETFAARAWGAVCRRAARLGVRASAVSASALVERIAAADLYLALACDEEVDGAWQVLTSRYEPRLRGLAVQRGLSATDAEELVANLLGDLIARPGRASTSTRLATYDGTGALWSWLAVILVRRIAERGAALDIERVAPRLLDAPSEPSDLVEEDDERAHLRPLLRAAWGALADREALALLYKYRDGLAQKHIARLFGVGEPRVSRILGSAVERLRSGLHRRLGAPGGDGDDGDWEVLRDLLGERLQETGPRTDSPARRREHRELV